VSAVLSALVVGVLWRARGRDRIVEIVDNEADLAALLEARREASGVEAEAPASDADLPALVREPLTRETALVFYPQLERTGYEFDPLRGVRRVPHLDIQRAFAEHPAGGWPIRTNALGLRDDEELGPERPELRIVLAGDSQTEGLCANSESFASGLEELLRSGKPERSVEVWNAGLGGTGPYYYLATLEALASLEPDLWMAVFYGGNDFKGVMAMQRFFCRRGPARSGKMLKTLSKGVAGIPEALVLGEIDQLCYFRSNPEDVEIAIATWTAIAVEMQKVCTRAGTRLLCVYMPPPLAGQPELYAAEAARLDQELRGKIMPVELTQQMADRDVTPPLGRRHADLRPAFRAATTRLFWETDCHLDLAGHRVVARWRARWRFFSSVRSGLGRGMERRRAARSMLAHAAGRGPPPPRHRPPDPELGTGWVVDQRRPRSGANGTAHI
jgi:hypothetical protein